jgi:3'-5' exonuclease
MERTHLVLDIETVLDPELPIPESGETEGLPPPPHHEIVCIGVLWFGANYEVRKVGIIGEDKPEPEVLADFSRFLERQRPVLVTFNGRGFDLPVIAARCFKHGQSLGYYYRERNVRYRFSVDGHMDLMDFLSDYGAAKRSRLDLSARLCGMPGKVGVDGKDVGPMVHAGRLSEVRAYCLCDVVQTAGVFLRTQLVRGEISREQYLQAMAGLMRAALNDRRLDPVTAAWNETRLLLGAGLADYSQPEAEAQLGASRC